MLENTTSFTSRKDEKLPEDIICYRLVDFSWDFAYLRKHGMDCKDVKDWIGNEGKILKDERKLFYMKQFNNSIYINLRVSVCCCWCKMSLIQLNLTLEYWINCMNTCLGLLKMLLGITE